MAMLDIGHEPNLEPPDYKVPRCPRCGSECVDLFLAADGSTAACNECWTPGTDFETIVDAWETMINGDIF